MKPEFAIVDANMLSCMGLQRLLVDIIPMVEITVFHSFEEMVVSNPERFVHFFVSSGIYFEHAQYFISQPSKSIVMVHGDTYPHMSGLITINVCQDEKSMVKSLLQLARLGHERRVEKRNTRPADGAPYDGPHISNSALLSPREIEVAILLAKGYINKEVADKLNISLNTAISHRKNIMEKLNARSLADIIVHVVMNGIIGLDEL